MAKLSITQIRELQKIYSSKINDYYNALCYPIKQEKDKLKSDIRKELENKAISVLESNGLKINRSRLEYGGYNNVLEYNSSIDASPKIQSLRKEEKCLCEARKQKFVELEQWYMKALRCTNPDDIPEFQVEILPSPIDCSSD